MVAAGSTVSHLVLIPALSVLFPIGKYLSCFVRSILRFFFLDGKPVSFYEVKMDKVNMNLSSWEAFDIFLVLW